MNRFSTTTAVLLSCCLCAEKLSAAFPEVGKARARGAQGQVTFCVVDSKGMAVRNAKVSGAFFPSDSYADATIFEGDTDTNGLFTAQGKTVDDINYTVTKEGFYKTTGKYGFYRRGENCVRDGRWHPWNPTHTVVIKEKRNPVPMYAKEVRLVVPKKGSPFDFDFEIGDWVAPYGKGKHPDIVVTFSSVVNSPLAFSNRFELAWLGAGNGFIKMTKDTWSAFCSVYEAPENDYFQRFVLGTVRTPNEIKEKDCLKNDEYLIVRVRSKLDEKGRVISATYGKIYGEIQYGDMSQTGGARFIYYFNPDGTKNLEFDPSHNLSGKERGKKIPMP